MSAEPTQHFIESQRLRLSYWDWGNEDAPMLLFVHGGRDHARAWDPLAEAFRDRYHVVAPDLRGHGDSEWSIGGAYSLPDNALDLVRVIEHVGGPAHVFSHSYGGSVSLIAAGSYPEHFASLAVLEGTHSLNPRKVGEMGPAWVQQWGDRLRSFEKMSPVVYPDLAAAEVRVREANPGLPHELTPHLTKWAARPVDGGYIWKYDWWVNARSSMEIRRDELPRFWTAIECPVMLLFARESHNAQRFDAEQFFRNASTVFIERSGHWAHHEQPDAVLAAIGPFFDQHS